ncbi:hypothetical protein [Haladaptatus sp. DJG-WS-42]|uniref:hypothetical protein n=1 Tax=Haladaptatus sp. DJG-WS-42 TaxID=3120516 RepID=UPI0030D5F1CD
MERPWRRWQPPRTGQGDLVGTERHRGERWRARQQRSGMADNEGAGDAFDGAQ